MKIHMDESMFERLTETSMEWGERWQGKLDRFECTEDWEQRPSLEWEIIYWIGENPASLVLARSWLLDQGHDVEAVWDMAEHKDGVFGYAILTNYRTASWKGKN